MKSKIVALLIAASLIILTTFPATAQPDLSMYSYLEGGAALTQHPEQNLSELPATPSTTDNGDDVAEESDTTPPPDQEEQTAAGAAAPLTLEINPASAILRSGGAGSQPAELVADNHCLLLRVDGRLFGWGDNTYSQLGLGAGADTKIYEPTEITFFADKGLKIKDVAVINNASFVLCTNGEIYSAGLGLNGRLGLGSTTNALTWTLIAGSQTLRFEKLYGTSGQEFMLAVTGNNELYGWGRNNAGQVGNGTKTDVLVPTLIMSNVDIKYLETGSDFALLIKQDNSAYVWGNNSGGRYGFNTGTIVPSSTAIANGTCSTPTGTSDACLTHQSSVCDWVSYTTCAGSWASYAAYGGTKGNNIAITLNEFSNPQQVVTGAGKQFTAFGTLSSAWSPVGTANGVTNNIYKYTSSATCAHNHNRVWDSVASCVASASAPATKSATRTVTATWQYELTNAFAYFDTGKTTEIQLGTRHGMAFIDGIYYGWGDNSLKQQGTSGNDNGYMVPLTTINNYINTLNSSGDGFGRLMVAGDTNFIITGTGDVAVWGSNANGKAGTGSGASYIDSPTQITALNGKATATLVSGRNHILALTHTGDVYAMGDNLYGQLGLGEAYKDEIKAASPVLIDTFKFSETAIVPDKPDGIDTPDEVEAGTDFEIHWSDVGADRYEIVRHFTPANIVAFADAPLSEEVVYTGDQTTFTDTIHEEGTAYYSGRAISFLGDYSAKATSSDILILPMSDTGNGGTGDDNNNNNGNNNNNNGGSGLTNEQLLELIAKLQGNGLDDATITAIIAALKGSGSGDVNVDVNTPATDNKDLLALIAALAAGNNPTTGGAAPASTNVYNQPPDYAGILSAFLGASEMDAENNNNGLLPIEHYVVKLMFEKMFPAEQPAPVAAQTTGAVVQPDQLYNTQQQSSGNQKFINIAIISAILLLVLIGCAVKFIPEGAQEEADEPD